MFPALRLNCPRLNNTLPGAYRSISDAPSGEGSASRANLVAFGSLPHVAPQDVFQRAYSRRCWAIRYNDDFLSGYLPRRVTFGGTGEVGKGSR